MKQYILKTQEDQSVASLPEGFDEGLNPAQKEAVYHEGTPLLVIAGAGSGKTKTLVHRVARLVHQGIDPERILLLTFTRKSSEEMLERATKILDSRCQRVSGGTFHGFAHQILRRYATRLGYGDQFTILDRGDSEDLVNLARRQLGYAKMDKRFPKKSTITSVIGKAINTGRSVEDVLNSDYPQFCEFTHEIMRISEFYHQQKKLMSVMDYDDLLVKMAILLEQEADIRDGLQAHYEHIMVDEYQDTNALQARVLRLIAGQNKNVMVVGDDAQSIYSFRGANFQNIMKFPELFPGAHVVMLEQNYRSTQPILDLTNAMIEGAKQRYAKNLYTEIPSDQRPIYVEASGESEQSQFVAQKILELREEGVPLSEIAILVRSGWHSNDLEVVLKSKNLPFQKFGGFKFMETSHVKDILAYLKLMANPKDSVAWHRVLGFLEGVGPKTAQSIITILTGFKGAFSPDILSSYSSKGFYNDLIHLSRLIFLRVEQNPVKLLESVVKYYKPHFHLRYDDYHKRQSDIDSLVTIAERYETLATLLSEMLLDPPDASQDESMPESLDDEKLTISTIHSAKGLEWHTVFLISAVDGYLPSFQSLGDLGQIEEERRLMYVALTRAKQSLFVIKPNLDSSSANRYKYSSQGMSFSNLSRFLTEKDIITRFGEKLALVPERPKGGFIQSFGRSVGRGSTSESKSTVNSFAEYNKKYHF